MTVPAARTGPAISVSRTRALVVLASVVLGVTVLLPILGRLGVLVFLAAGVCCVFLARDRLSAYAGDVVLFLAPPAIAVLSATTSLHPSVTLWYGTQYTLSALVFFTLVLSLPMLVLARIASVAIWVGLALSVVDPTYHHVGHTGETAFVGIFQSKNNYSFIVGTLVVLGAAQTVSGGRIGRAFGLASLCVGFAFLLAGRSLGAIVGASAALGVAVAFVATRVFDRAVLAAGLVVAAAVALAATLWLTAEFELVAARMAAVGRDPTLTGRTILWELAVDNFTAAPLLGVGYRGFFVPYYPPAVEVLAYFHMSPDSAWHYHNAFFDVLAGTGVLGVAAHALLLGRIVGLFATLVAADRLRGADAGIVAAFSYLALRSVLEVDFTVEYALGLFLYGLVHGHLARRAAERGRRTGQRRTVRPLRAPETAERPA